MKLCKVEIEKIYSEYPDGSARCDNVYPDGYDAEKIRIISYDENPLNRGKNTGYCLGIVADDFTFTDKMTEITRPIAKAFILARARQIAQADERAKYEARQQEVDNV